MNVNGLFGERAIDVDGNTIDIRYIKPRRNRECERGEEGAENMIHAYGQRRPEPHLSLVCIRKEMSENSSLICC